MSLHPGNGHARYADHDVVEGVVQCGAGGPSCLLAGWVVSDDVSCDRTNPSSIRAE